MKTLLEKNGLLSTMREQHAFERLSTFPSQNRCSVMFIARDRGPAVSVEVSEEAMENHRIGSPWPRVRWALRKHMLLRKVVPGSLHAKGMI